MKFSRIFENKNTQRGQSLILVTIFLVALIAILALTIDGANGYLKRRQAQNAADAGALAGARVYCADPENSYSAAINTALEYVGLNDASCQAGYPTINNNKVTVGTTITFDTFFGKVLGLPQITANAIAVAGCYSPCYSEGVLPIVWTCSTDDNPAPGLVNCDQLSIPQSKLWQYEGENPPGECSVEPTSGGVICPELTIVKDNIDVDDLLVCAEPGVTPIPDGQLDCDLNNDGRNDYISAENRGWSDLDGNMTYSCDLDPTSEGGPPELSDWIENGYRCGIRTHTWVGDQAGDPVPIYNAVDQYAVDRFSLLPVFSKPPCEGDPRVEPECEFHNGDLVHDFTSSVGQTKYYHIIEFAVFYVTCVQTKSGDCPAATKFQEVNPAVPNQYRSIEGYFISDYEPGTFGKCEFNPDAAFTVYLDK